MKPGWHCLLKPGTVRTFSWDFCFRCLLVYICHICEDLDRLRGGWKCLNRYLAFTFNVILILVSENRASETFQILYYRFATVTTCNCKVSFALADCCQWSRRTCDVGGPKNHSIVKKLLVRDRCNFHWVGDFVLGACVQEADVQVDVAIQFTHCFIHFASIRISCVLWYG